METSARRGIRGDIRREESHIKEKKKKSMYIHRETRR